jgi:hypothetical protein
MLIGIIAALVIVALIGVYLLGRSSGEKTATATTPTATQKTTPTQTTQASTQTVVTVSAPPAETPAPPASTVALEITERTAKPGSVSTGMPIEYAVKVKGEATYVTMSIKGPLNMSVPLPKVATIGEITTWAATIPAPVEPGIYHYYASAIGTDGTTVEMPGVSGWTFEVTP